MSVYIWDGTKKTLVARGKVFEVATVLHGMELSEDEVKVTVEEVLMSFALVPMPTDEVGILWHRHSSVSSPGLEIWLLLTSRYRLLNPQIYNIFKFTCLLYSNLNYIPF